MFDSVSPDLHSILEPVRRENFEFKPEYRD